MSSPSVSPESLQREIRELREQVYSATDTVRLLLKNHSAQLDIIALQLERLEAQLNRPPEEKSK